MQLLWTIMILNQTKVSIDDNCIFIFCVHAYYSLLSIVGLVANGTNSSKAPASKPADNMQEFFSDVEIVKTAIATIKESTRKISDINQNVVQATTIEREQDQSSELEPIIKLTNKKATLAKQLLQRLKEETDKNKAQNGQKSPEVRIRENMVNTLTRKFIDVMKEYQNAQTKFKTDIKKKVKRQVQIVKPDATTEEIDAVFKSGGGSGEFVKSAILTVRLFTYYVSLKERKMSMNNMYGSFYDLYRINPQMPFATPT